MSAPITDISISPAVRDALVLIHSDRAATLRYARSLTPTLSKQS